MTANQQEPASPKGRAKSAWYALCGWCGNRPALLRRVRNVALTLGITLLVLASATYFTVQYILWPKVEGYKSDIERIASEAIGKSVSIKNMRASWEGFNPQVRFEEIAMRDAKGQVLLTLPRVSATISWKSLPLLSPRFKYLEIRGPDLDIRRDEQNNIHVAGMLFDSGKETDSDGAQWLLQQREISIRDASIRWKDNLRRAPELALKNVQLTVLNTGRSHRFNLTATPPTSLAGPIEIDADFTHPFFAADISDVSHWKGVLYANLRDADLIAWKPYFDYPIELHKGFGSVRAWLTVDDSRIARFAAELSVKDVVTRLGKDLETLNLTELQGRISGRGFGALSPKNGNLALGDSGHRIRLTNLSLKTKEGLVLPETSITQEHTTEMYGAPSKTFFRVSQLDLERLAQFAKYVPLAPDMRKMLADLAPKGEIKNFELQWEGSYPQLVSYRVSGDFSGLTLKSQSVRADDATAKEKARVARMPGIPGFDNLTGRIHANQLGGNIDLDSQNVTLHFPGVFKQPALKFEMLKTHAEWAFRDKNKQFEFVLGKTAFVHEGIKGTLEGKHLRALNAKNQSPGYLELKGAIDGVDVKRLDELLPTQTPDGTRRWLTGGIEAGYARNIQFKLKGNLADFPFTPNRAGGSSGEFFVSTQLEDATLNYSPGDLAPDGKSPLWPKAEKIQGRLTVRGSRMDIWAQTAQTANVTLTDVSAIIPDMLSDDVSVEISGHASGAMQDFLRYVKISPVDKWLGNLTEDTQASGNAKLHLQLSLPVNHIIDAKARGILEFDNNDVKLFKDLPMLSNTKGRLQFSEKGFELQDIRTSFLGGDARLSGGTQKDGKFLIKASGALTMDAVRKAYPGVMKGIQGKTSYAVSIKEKGRQPDIEVASDLRGIVLDFPSPLNKTAQEALPLKVNLKDRSSSEGGPLRDQIDIHLGQHLHARYQRQKGSGPDANWQVSSGGIGFDSPPPEPATGVAMRLVVGPVDVDVWKRVLTSVFGEKKNEQTSAAQADDEVIQYFTPTSFSIKTPRLHVSGLQLDQVELQLERRDKSIQVGIKSKQATGTLNITEDEKEGYNKIIARLSSLNIAESSIDKASEVLEASDRTTALPNLDVIAEDFEIYGKKLGRLELLAGNVPGTSGRRWNIRKLQISNSGGTLKASGKWTARKGASKTRMRYAIELKNAGDLLTRLGFTDVMRDGEGRVEGTLQWDGTPFALDKPSLAGQISLGLKKGQFLPAEPGVAKLLNVLSLQSLPRRLLLDFRDVFSKGYAFDRMTATANISKGVLSTRNLKMRGVGMAVMMEGTADVVNETQDLHVVVIPELDTTAASLAAMVVNPVVGVGTFLAQYLLKDPLKRAMTYEYQVTGSWAEPSVTKIERKKEGKKGFLEQLIK